MKLKYRLGAGIGLLGVLSVVIAVWWIRQGSLTQSYILVMIPSSAIGAILVFGEVLGDVQARAEAVAKFAGILASSHEDRITALEVKVGQMAEFMAKREGYAEGFVDAAVAQETSGFGSVHRFRPMGNGPHEPGS